MSLAVQVTVTAADPRALARFWAVALGYRAAAPPDASGRWARLVDPEGRGPRLFFQPAEAGAESGTGGGAGSRGWTGSGGRVPGENRLHLDVHASAGVTGRERVRAALRAHAAVLVDAGATVVRECDEPDQCWIVMLDPEGNQFCLD